jgi:hypothetical protein
MNRQKINMRFKEDQHIGGQQEYRMVVDFLVSKKSPGMGVVRQA